MAEDKKKVESTGTPVDQTGFGGDEFFKDLFKDENIPESNWMKFEKVGDKVAGVLVEVKDRPGKDNFPPQRVFVLKQADGTLMNVGISLNRDYVIGRANAAKLGDLLGFQFIKEVPSATKGFSPAKSIEVYIKHIEATDQMPF